MAQVRYNPLPPGSVETRGGLEPADLLHPPHVQLNVRPVGSQHSGCHPERTRSGSAQVRLSVDPEGGKSSHNAERPTRTSQPTCRPVGDMSGCSEIGLRHAGGCVLGT